MDQKQAIKLVKQYSELVIKYFNVKRVILFGSYSTNLAREDSDIDVAIVVDKIDEDFLDSEIKLHKLKRDLNERIEPILLEESNDVSGFLEEILKYGIIIY